MVASNHQPLEWPGTDSPSLLSAYTFQALKLEEIPLPLFEPLTLWAFVIP